MGQKLRIAAFALSFLSALAVVHPAWAVVTTGTGGSGVTVGSSSLSGQLDVSDTFTGTPDGSANPNRPYFAALQPAPAYVVENTYGNLGRSWTGGFSFASDAGVANPGFVDGSPAYPGNAGANSNTSGSGSSTGFTQTGGGVDYGVNYGLRNRFVAQFDAVQVNDRIDITSSNAAGTIFSSPSLSVFFRPTGNGTEIGLYNGAVETATTFTSGVALGTWNNYAVEYNRFNNSINIYTNETLRGTVDLNTFAGGAYANFGTGAVSFGAGLAGGENRTWTDNAQIGLVAGTALPGPASLVSYIPFDESASGNGIAFDQIHANNGTFAGATPRTTGLIGPGAIAVNGNGTNSANLGTGQNGVNNLFSFTSGLTVEAIFSSTTLANSEQEIFRKEDGGNRILLSFQSAGNTNNDFGQFVGGADENLPGISFGINAGGYGELDVELDGQNGRPTLADLNDGDIHHIVATYDAISGEKSIYIDGELVGQVDLGNNLNMISGGAANAFIGTTDGGSEPFNGTLDEFAIYNSALTPDEIAAHFANVQDGNNYFAAAAAVPEPASVALWSLVFGAVIGCGWLKLRRRK